MQIRDVEEAVGAFAEVNERGLNGWFDIDDACFVDRSNIRRSRCALRVKLRESALLKNRNACLVARHIVDDDELAWLIAAMGVDWLVSFGDRAFNGRVEIAHRRTRVGRRGFVGISARFSIGLRKFAAFFVGQRSVVVVSRVVMRLAVDCTFSRDFTRNFIVRHEAKARSWIVRKLRGRAVDLGLVGVAACVVACSVDCVAVHQLLVHFVHHVVLHHSLLLSGLRHSERQCKKVMRMACAHAFSSSRSGEASSTKGRMPRQKGPSGEHAAVTDGAVIRRRCEWFV